MLTSTCVDNNYYEKETCILICPVSLKQTKLSQNAVCLGKAKMVLGPTPRSATADAEKRALLVGSQGYQRFPVSKPVVGWNIAMPAVPAYRAVYLPT